MKMKRMIRLGTGFSGLSICLIISLSLHALGISVVIYKAGNRTDIAVEEYATKISLGMVAAKSGARPTPSVPISTHPITLEKPSVAPSPKTKPLHKFKPNPIVKQRQPYVSQPKLQPASPPMRQTNIQQEAPARIEGATGSSIQSSVKIETGNHQEEGAASAQTSYDARVLRHLKKYKRYPVKAKRRHIEGNVRVRFEIDRLGQLISSSIIEGGQGGMLNRAAILQINRAAPFPHALSETKWQSRAYAVVIEYSLKTTE